MKHNGLIVLFILYAVAEGTATCYFCRRGFLIELASAKASNFTCTRVLILWHYSMPLTVFGIQYRAAHRQAATTMCVLFIDENCLCLLHGSSFRANAAHEFSSSSTLHCIHASYTDLEPHTQWWCSTFHQRFKITRSKVSLFSLHLTLFTATEIRFRKHFSFFVHLIRSIWSEKLFAIRLFICYDYSSIRYIFFSTIISKVKFETYFIIFRCSDR